MNEKLIEVQAPQKRGLTLAERATLATGAIALAGSANAADVDVSAGTAVIAGGVAVIALVGAAKIVPNATIQVWGYVKQAFNRT
ncbi:hypothetical protein C3F34_16810 [Acinetobacter sp. ACNIH2]|uniref:hypothetical protein n=1 Tax=Acinetobacter sp. ACNIH2 TaxID=1758189 RepID=UPI000CDC90E2|nr:hypothetical protein [Acinetobacter sp. ACNIH2]AUX87545.1 hypothetical protein C3F34_16810 [Acinetobacter sp. ACNIH2]